jgi:predicted PurR-regulated permease PerM
VPETRSDATAPAAEPHDRQDAGDSPRHREDPGDPPGRREAPGLPFGRPGRPFSSTPFTFGFTAALGVLSAWLLVQSLSAASSVLIVISMALFLAVGLNPVVEWLCRRGVPRRLAIAAVFVMVIAFFTGFAFAIVPAVSDQAGQFVEQLPAYVTQLQSNPQIRDLDQRYGLLERAAQYLTSGQLGQQLFGGILGVASIVISAVFTTLTLLILTLYFLAALPSITRTGYRLVPRTRRPRVQMLGDEILRRVGGYVAGNLLISLIAGVTSFVFLSIAGVPYALPLSIIVAITDLIPLIGAGIGAAIATLSALFVSLPVTIATLVFFIVYQQVENYWIAPRVMKSSVDVPAATTIVAALIGGTLLGVVGALLAIPAAAALQLIVAEVVVPRQERN